MIDIDSIGICPICGGRQFEAGYKGRVLRDKKLPRCANCKSAERHRIVRLMYTHLVPLLKSWRALQFAPDRTLKKEWFKELEYSRFGGHNSLDMTAIDLPDSSVNLIVSNHVIEHVSDDIKAMRECLRVVGNAGVVHVTAPNPAGRYLTDDWGYADPNKIEHYRVYGADMGRVLSRAADGVHCVGIVGMDPVTLLTDVVFFFSRSECSLMSIVNPLQRARYGCVVVT